MTDLQKRHEAGLRFDWVVVRELVFEDKRERTERERFQNLSLSISVDSTIADDNKSCRVYMRMTVEQPDDVESNFEQIVAAVEGKFSVVGETPTVKLEDFVNRQAPAILMPYLRQAISAGTALSRFGQLLIPPINVVAVLEDMQKAEAQQQEIEQP